MFTRWQLPLAAGLALVAALGIQDAEAPAPEREPLVPTYLANEGFLVEVGDESSPGRAILKDYLPADAHVAMHLPLKDLESVVASLAAGYPRVRAYTKSLQSERFE